MSQFKQGQDNILTICFPDGDELTVTGENDKIRVEMENGQWAGVPWFEVVVDGKIKSKWNAANCQGVVFKSEPDA